MECLCLKSKTKSIDASWSTVLVTPCRYLWAPSFLSIQCQTLSSQPIPKSYDFLFLVLDNSCNIGISSFHILCFSQAPGISCIMTTLGPPLFFQIKKLITFS